MERREKNGKILVLNNKFANAKVESMHSIDKFNEKVVNREKNETELGTFMYSKGSAYITSPSCSFRSQLGLIITYDKLFRFSLTSS